MTGCVNRYNPNRHTGFIYSFTNKWTYRFNDSDVEDGDIANGYIVDFYVEFDEELQKKCAKGIHVIDSSNGIYNEEQSKSKKKTNSNRHRKGCNADKVAYNDGKFRKFIKSFMREQQTLLNEGKKLQ